MNLRWNLLDALLLAIPANERVKDSEYVAAVFDNAGEDVAQLRLTLCFAMPLGEDRRWHLDVAAQLFRRMAAQEKAIEKSGFPLRDIEVQRDFGRNELCHRGHGERAVYRKASRRQVVPELGCYVAGNPVPRAKS
jgi:hypothetical protein